MKNGPTKRRRTMAKKSTQKALPNNSSWPAPDRAFLARQNAWWRHNKIHRLESAYSSFFPFPMLREKGEKKIIEKAFSAWNLSHLDDHFCGLECLCVCSFRGSNGKFMRLWREFALFLWYNRITVHANPQFLRFPHPGGALKRRGKQTVSCL